MRVARLNSGGVIALLLMAIPGCGNSSGLSKVEGIVTLDGKPVGRAIVTFAPMDQTGRTAACTTASDGSFSLRTFKDGDGAFPGKYRVTVHLVEHADDSVAAPVIPADSGPEMMGKLMGGRGNNSPRAEKKAPDLVIPDLYAEFADTPLEQVVPTNGKIRLELDSKVPPAPKRPKPQLQAGMRGPPMPGGGGGRGNGGGKAGEGEKKTGAAKADDNPGKSAAPKDGSKKSDSEGKK